MENSPAPIHNIFTERSVALTYKELGVLAALFDEMSIKNRQQARLVTAIFDIIEVHLRTRPSEPSALVSIPIGSRALELRDLIDDVMSRGVLRGDAARDFIRISDKLEIAGR